MIAALWNLHDALMAGDQPNDCPDCGADEWSPSAEAFESTGRLVCEHCADAAMEKAMTDTVTVPREPTQEMVDRAQEFWPDIRDMWSAMLAAAPKAEPVGGSIAEMVSELVNETAPDQGQTPSLAFALALSLQAAIASQPEAPKVEQEPVAWRPVWSDGTAYGEPKNWPPLEGASTYHGLMGRTIQPLYTHPAPASDELLEALREVTPELTAEFANIDGPWCRGQMDMDEVWWRLIDAQIAAIAKHKGPQS